MILILKTSSEMRSLSHKSRRYFLIWFIGTQAHYGFLQNKKQNINYFHVNFKHPKKFLEDLLKMRI